MDEELLAVFRRLRANAGHLAELADVTYLARSRYSGWAEFSRGGRLAGQLSDVLGQIRLAADEVVAGVMQAQLVAAEAGSP